MKKILLIAALVVLSTTAFASCDENKPKKGGDTSSEEQKKLPVISFEKTEHDFGKIAKGVPVETVFKFTNTGNAPLIITNATSSCGCTVPEKPDGVIAPGQSSEIKVRYNASGSGQVTKLITVEGNTASGREVIKIKAFVEEEKK